MPARSLTNFVAGAARRLFPFQGERPPLPAELGGLLRHPLRHFVVIDDAGCAGSELLRQLHRAELRAAHRAEMRYLGAVGGQRLVVEGARGDGIEREVELILPAELEARLRE